MSVVNEGNRRRPGGGPLERTAFGAIVAYYALAVGQTMSVERDVRANDAFLYFEDALNLRRWFLGEASWENSGLHPLYDAVLALIAVPDDAFYIRARLLNLGLALTALALTLVLVRRSYGAVAGLIAGLVLVVSPEFVYMGALVGTEPLLVVCVLASVAFVSKGKGGAAGAAAGAAWMTKGTGLLLLPAHLAALVARRLTKHPGEHLVRNGLLLAIAFAFVSLPVWGTAWMKFGSPLGNFHFEAVDPRGGTLRGKVAHPSIADRIAEGAKTAPVRLAYALFPYGVDWLDPTARAAVLRVARGVGLRPTSGADAGAPGPGATLRRNAPVPARTAGDLVFAGSVLVLIAVGTLRALRIAAPGAPLAPLPAAAFGAAFLLASAWLSVQYDSPHYYVPVLPFAAVFLGVAAAGVIPERGASALAAVCLGLTVLAGGLRLVSGPIVAPGNAGPVREPHVQEMLARAAEVLPPDARCAYSSTAAQDHFEWVVPGGRVVDDGMYTVPTPRYREMATAGGTRCVLIDADVALRAVEAGTIDYARPLGNGRGALDLDALPDGFAPIAHGPEPVRWAIVRVVPLPDAGDEP